MLNPTSVFKVVSFAAVLNVLAIIAIWLTIDRSAAEKTAVNLAMPTGLLWFALNCLLLMSWQRCSKAVFRSILCVWLLFTLCGNGQLAQRAAGTLEAPYRNVDPLAQPPFDAVILLGGGATEGGNGRQQGNGSGDRLILAAQLYHQQRTKQILCTGRRIKSMNSSGFDPADQSAEILLKLGVPAAAIEKVGGRTTSEEMQSLGQRFRAGDHRVGVVTSAWHMRRAIRLARKNGLSLQPLPADFMCGPLRPLTTGELINTMIPQAGAFLTHSRVLKEYLGILVGR